MRVLLLFPMADGQTGPAIQHAFVKLGHEVLAVDAKIEPDNSCPSAFVFKPDLIFCSRTYTLAEQVAEIKKRFKDAKICMWNVDTRSSIQEWDFLFPLIKLCDYHFVVESNQLFDWREINHNTFWLPQGLQEEVYHKPDRITKFDILKYECDVSFAGSCTGYHRWRMPYLQAIENMGVKFKKWGCDGQPQVYNEEHNKMAALSKINFAYSGWHENGKYVSVRDYKILGAGGFLMEFQQDGLNDIFPLGSLLTYDSPENLVHTIEISLEAEHMGKQYAKNGYKYVHSQATYTHRIQRALEIMKLK